MMGLDDYALHAHDDRRSDRGAISYQASAVTCPCRVGMPVFFGICVATFRVQHGSSAGFSGVRMESKELDGLR